MAERSKIEDLLSLYIPSFFIFVGAGIVSPVLSIYAKDFGVNFAMVSLAVSLYSVGRLVMDFPAGILAERYGRRPVMHSDPYDFQLPQC
jgi:MFS family permease